MGRYIKCYGEIYKRYADDNLPVTWILMHNNNLKHSATSVKSWLEKNKINVLEWPPQSSDLNPIENLWNDIGVVLQDKQASNFNEFKGKFKKSGMTLLSNDVNGFLTVCHQDVVK